MGVHDSESWTIRSHAARPRGGRGKPKGGPPRPRLGGPAGPHSVKGVHDSESWTIRSHAARPRGGRGKPKGGPPRPRLGGPAGPHSVRDSESRTLIEMRVHDSESHPLARGDAAGRSWTEPDRELRSRLRLRATAPCWIRTSGRRVKSPLLYH